MEQDSNGDDSGRTGSPATGRHAPFRRDPPRWLQRQSRLLMALDGIAAAGATLISQVWSFGWSGTSFQVRSLQVPYTAAVLVTVPVWLVILATHRCNDVGPFGFVKNEFRRVIGAGANFLAVIAVAYYAVRLERLAREFLIIVVPLAVGLTLLGRLVARYQLRVKRERGHASRRAVVMGPRRSVSAILDHLAQHPHSGIEVTAALTGGNGSGRQQATEGEHPLAVGDVEVPVIGTPDALLDALPATDADLLLITGGLIPGELRKLTWTLEETGVEVLVAPAAAHVADPQFDVRPVAGLPLLYVDHTTYLPQRIAL